MLTRRKRQVIVIALVHFIRIVIGDNAIIEPKCKFTSQPIQADCSDLKLTAIPKIVENTTESLNLSLNAIQYIDDFEFRRFGKHLRVLDLSSNQLFNITDKSFHGAGFLEVLLLSSNKLTILDPHSFQTLTSLKRLDLSGNSLVLPEGQSGFLVQNSLEALNLDNCNLDTIPETTFINLPQLRNLTLSGNLFSENLDVSAFDHSAGLITLRISNLSETTTYVLCEKLTVIDTIQFNGFNISCTLLSGDDNSFQDGIVEEPKLYSPMSSPVTTRRITKPPSTSTHSSTQTSLEFTTTSTGSPLETAIETIDESSTNKTKIDTKSATFEIENETIKYILIGIFCVTVTGIFVGVVCRLDVCQVKTKMCRRNAKNRRGTIEAASPFEEVPLNTVNGNGKIEAKKNKQGNIPV